MSFLEWRRFNFFDINHNADSKKISQIIGNSKITSTSSGNGYLVICDDDGLVHLITRTFQVTTFRAYQSAVLLATQLQYSNFLVTIGIDEPDSNAILKVWDLERRDRQSNPICVRSTKLSKSEKPTTLCATDNRLLMAVGFVDGCIALYKGDLSRDRNSKPKMLKELGQEITGMAFSSVIKNQWYLFVSTASSVQQFNVTSKDSCPMTILDAVGCDFKCSVLVNGPDSHFMIAKEDAIYCYTVDSRGPCYVVGGKKIILQWFRSYLIIVSKEVEKSSNTVTVSTTTKNFDEIESVSITILDIQNKFIVFTVTIREILSVLPEWGSLYILTTGGNLSQLIEKDLQSKLTVLFKKNLYDVAVRMAKCQQYDSQALIDIFRQYGDHLYTKGDHSGAVEQYIKTIGKLEPSYVIKKFLDSQYIESLTTYLHALHKSGNATKDHTTLLFNCYSKLNSVDKLQEFIITKDENIDFDVDVAIQVCRQSSPENALKLAEKHDRHSLYIKILLEDRYEYTAALEYIEKLSTEQSVQTVKQYSNVFMENVPKETVTFLKKLCSTSYTSGNVDLSDSSAQPEDFIYLLLDDSECLVDFLEHFENYLDKWSTSLLNIYIEHCLIVWKNESNQEKRTTIENKIINILQSHDIKTCDYYQVLILAMSFDFKPAIVYIFEHNKQYTKLIHYYLSLSDYSAAIDCCRKYGPTEPMLWILVFNTAMGDEMFPSSMLEEILNEIEKKSLLSAHFTITSLIKSKNVKIGHIRAYLTSLFGAEKKTFEKEKEMVNKYQKDSENIKNTIQKLKNCAIVFQGLRCSACNNQLELPSVHFMCQHSYHQHCFQAFSESDNDCPACTPNNKKIMDVIRTQGQIKDDEALHNQLKQTTDSFSLISEYFGRCLFDDPSTFENQLAKFKLSSPVLLSPKLVVPAVQTPPKLSPILAVRTIKPSTNPFDEDDDDQMRYDDNKNPFKTDYDETKNPFADDM
ncbi:Zinc finger, RING-type,WD40-repeat-containing domain,Vacuolar protein sorting protein 11, C- [Cinara cedri]|uniref:Vacuolar protein sorting-associated protein 11 homolog n=1 Tax=Cinara cedri TaxID=506608 RepID=A0A5E4NNX6_9HEMI|nr:Zinc finger, RING-type,WD40-repeat-containing domain,Vacuolar protein sorting protein 11, C- [Cinara cedri]